MSARYVGALAALLVVALAAPAGAQVASQTLTLRPGWNAIYLEVQPEPRDPGQVFAGLVASERLRSVWRFARSLSTVEFVQSPSEILPGDPQWLVYFPDASPEAFLTNLDEMQVNRPYLVNLSPGPAVEIVLSGRPQLRRLRWQPDAFTLTGFPVDPASPASFDQFFEASPAHADGLVYALEPNGVWEPVVMAGPIDSGAAYWVFTDGASQHQGPIDVTPPSSTGLEFGEFSGAETLRVRRRSGPANVSVTQLPAPAPVALAYRTVALLSPVAGGDPFCQVTWLPLPSPLSLPEPPCAAGAGARTLGVGQEVALILGAVRRDFVAAEVGSVLEISNGAGIRWRLPVHAINAAMAGGAP